MRRPHVYERSATRAGRGSRPEPSGDYGHAARAALLALPDLIRQAEAAGAVALARHLAQVLSEPKGIAERDRSPPRWHRLSRIAASTSQVQHRRSK